MSFADSYPISEIPLLLTAKCFACRKAYYSLYEMGCSLNKSQRRAVLHRLNQNNYSVRLLEFYQYAPTPSMQHLFVYLEGSTSALPWYLLPPSLYRAIAVAVYESFSS